MAPKGGVEQIANTPLKEGSPTRDDTVIRKSANKTCRVLTICQNKTVGTTIE